VSGNLTSTWGGAARTHSRPKDAEDDLWCFDVGDSLKIQVIPSLVLLEFGAIELDTVRATGQTFRSLRIPVAHRPELEFVLLRSDSQTAWHVLRIGC